MPEHQAATESVVNAIDVGLRIVDLESVPAQYVNVLSANHDSESFQLVFAQLLQPVMTEPADVDEIRERGYLEARAITRLILAPSMMERTIEVLRMQIERRDQQRADQSQGGADDLSQ